MTTTYPCELLEVPEDGWETELIAIHEDPNNIARSWSLWRTATPLPQPGQIANTEVRVLSYIHEHCEYESMEGWVANFWTGIGLDNKCAVVVAPSWLGAHSFGPVYRDARMTVLNSLALKHSATTIAMTIKVISKIYLPSLDLGIE